MQFFSVKPQLINHVNTQIIDDKIICLKCVCQFFSFLLGDFLFENFLSIQAAIQTLKKMFYIVS